MAVDKPSLDYQKMLAKWELPVDLLGGTPAMRDKRTVWLPKEPNESDAAYELRLNRTVLFNIYRQTVEQLVGNAFSRNIEVNNIPEELEYLEWNINGEGQSITELASKLFHDALVFGKSHTYTDFPATDTSGMTYADYKAADLKPYVMRVSPLNVIGWKHDYENGVETLRNVRIKDTVVEQDDDYSEKYVSYVRVIEDDRIRVYRSEGGMAALNITPATNRGSYELVSDYENTLGKIPLLCSYANKKAPFVAEPTLDDLAWLNLLHYQSSSDQRNILHVARVPFMLGVGFEDKELENITLAASRMVLSTNKDAKISYVEHTGRAIEAGEKDLKNIEEQAAKSGANILFSKSVARQTAEARRIDRIESLNTVQTILRSIEQQLEQAFILAAEWLDIDSDFDISINIGTDLEMPHLPNPVEAIIKMQEMLNLSDEKLVEEIKRYKLISPHIKASDVNLTKEPEPASNPFVPDAENVEEEPNSREDENNVNEERTEQR